MVSVLQTVKSSSLENNIYLKKGKYSYNLTSKACIYKNTPVAIDFVRKITNNRISASNFIPNIIASLFNLFSPVRIPGSEESLFAGEVLMQTIDNDIKIFDFDKQVILTKVNDVEIFENLKHITDYFEKYYLLTLVEYDDHKHFIIDRIVAYKPYDEWTVKDKQLVITSLFNSLRRQVNDAVMSPLNYISTNDLLLSIQSTGKHTEFTKVINSLIDQDQYDDQWPMIRCHGDLNFNNTLLEDHSVYVIDWDDSSEAVFFYDVMNCLFVDSMYLNDFTYLDLYFDGAYDDHFLKIFQSLGLEFCKDKKAYYLIIYIIVRINTYEYKKNMDNLDSIIQKYLNVINRIKLYANE